MLIKNENTSDKNDYLNCKVCSRRFFTKFGLKIHSSSHHKKDAETKVNQLQQSQQSQLEQSQISEHSLCNVSFESEKDLQLHISKEHKKLIPHQWDASKNSFWDKADLKKEKQNDYKRSTTVCQECNKTFRQNRYLQTHISIVHRKLTPYPCEQCYRSFGQKIHLKTHINTVHRKLKLHQCQECKKSFGRKDHLQKHVKTLHQNLLHNNAKIA